MKKRFTLTLDEEIVKAAKKKTIDEGISFSALVEMLLHKITKKENDFDGTDC